MGLAVTTRCLALDITVKLPERVAVAPGVSIVGGGLCDAIEDALTDLNDKARRELARYPKPDNCPETGSWVRAASLDDDMRPDPRGIRHLVVGWHGQWGRLGLAGICNSRSAPVFRVAIASEPSITRLARNLDGLLCSLRPSDRTPTSAGAAFA